MSDETWSGVHQELSRLLALLDTPRDPKRVYAFADGFARLVKAYHVALKAEGKTSVRIQAVEKALDLATAKSLLQRFVAGDTEPPGN
ncbi:MAG: hypothetical protein ACAI38_00405 [Myxococcota bacterium]